MKRLIVLAVVLAALAGCQKKAEEAAPAADAAAAPEAHVTTEPSADAPAGALPGAQTTHTPPKKP